MQFDFMPDDDETPKPEQPPEAPAVLQETQPDQPARPAPAKPPARGGREWLLGAVGIAALGLVTLLMFGGRSETSSTAIAASTAPAPAARTAARPAAAAASTRTWISKHDVWLGRAKGVAFELPSETLASVWMRTVRPALIVRCTAKKTEVFVFTDSAAAMEPDTEDHSVTFALDDEPATSERWPDAAEHNALFAPDGKALAARIMAAQRMRFSFRPHNAPAATVTFSVAGLANLLAPAAKDCGH